MRLHIVSDIHDDHGRAVTKRNWNLPRDVEADVVIVAGDIAGRGSRMGRSWLESQVTGHPLICVLGNHDFWHASIDTEVGKLKAKLKADWVHVLDGDQVTIGNTRFVGATLWTDYEAKTPGNPEKGMLAAAAGLNDFHYVRADNKARRARPEDLRLEHVRQLAAIEAVLATPFDGPTVVVTHHAPSTRSLEEGRPTADLDGAYASRLDDVILRWQPEVWIHGHVHRRQDYMIGRTRVVCNPKGYVRAFGREVEHENSGFDPRFVVDVQPHPKPTGRAVMKPDMPAIDEDMRRFLDGEELKFAAVPADEDHVTNSRQTPILS